MNYPDDLFEEAARREEENKKDFYRFFSVQYFATGEGISYWLKICRNYESYDGKDYDLERFKEFINDEYHFNGIEEHNEEEFMTSYANLIPPYVVKMIERKDQPALDWETHFYFNYS